MLRRIMLLSSVFPTRITELQQVRMLVSWKIPGDLYQTSGSHERCTIYKWSLVIGFRRKKKNTEGHKWNVSCLRWGTRKSGIPSMSRTRHNVGWGRRPPSTTMPSNLRQGEGPLGRRALSSGRDEITGLFHHIQDSRLYLGKGVQQDSRRVHIFNSKEMN